MNLRFLHLRSLKARVTLATLGVFMLSTVLLGSYASRLLREDLGQDLGAQQFATVSLLAAQVDDALRSQIAALEVVAAKMDSPMLGSRPALQSYLEQQRHLATLFNGGVLVTGTAGSVLADYPPTSVRVGINISERDYMVRALKEGKSSVGQAIIGKGLKVPAIPIAAPIRDAQGQVIGVLVGVVNLAKPNFLDKVTNSPYGKTGGYVIADRAHRLVIASTDKSLAMTALAGAGVTPEVDRFLAGFEGTQVFAPPMGSEMMASAKSIPAAGWMLASYLPTAEVFAPIARQQQRMLMAVLVIALLSSSLIWWLSSRIVKRQLAPMLAATHSLGESARSGQIAQALTISSQDEVGQLIAGFNRLLGVIKHDADRWHFAIEGSGAGVWDWNIQTGEATLSKRWKEMLGYVEHEIGNHADEWSSRVHPDDLLETMRCIQEHMAGKTASAVTEFRMRAKDGRYIWMLGRGMVVSHSADGKPLRLVGTQEDITSRRQLEQDQVAQAARQAHDALNQEHEIVLKENLWALTEAQRIGHVGTYVTDIKTGHWTGTAVLDGIFGIDASFEKNIPNWNALIAPEYQQALLDHYYAVIGGNGKFDMEYEVIRPADGERRWVEALGEFSLDAQGAPEFLRGTIRDITEQKHARIALQQYRDHLETLVEEKTAELKKAMGIASAANRAKSEFLANMSHEIRTPMNGVVGMVDILQETEMTAAQHRMLSTIHHSSMALLQILNDILDFSKIEAGKLEIESIPTYLREVAEGATQLMLSLSGARSVELSVFVSPELPIWFLCDPTRLRQVLLNLLGNAVKFSGTQGGRSARVALRVEPVTQAQGGLGVRLSVTDNGIGMRPEVVERLFQPFMQADESTARQFGGTGLGLSITQRLVDLMHGQVSVCSTLGEGSEFVVELPLRACGPGRKLPAEPNLAGVRVIAVTRDAQTMEILFTYGQAGGATVVAAPDVAAAHALVLQSPDQGANTVVLIDVAISTPTAELDFPSAVGVVRLTLRSSDSLAPDIKLFVHPMLFDDLIHTIAQACGRVGASPAVRSAAQHTDQQRPTAPTVEAAVQAGCLILLAEDNETNSEVMQEQLRLLGYTCEMAEDGTIALQMWQNNPQRYALLLCDCHMPNLDGFGLTAAIRAAEPTGTRLPIIAVTANAMQGEAQRCRERGMDDYLCKPLRMHELRNTLEKWLPLPEVAVAFEVEVGVDRGIEDGSSDPVLPIWNPFTLAELVGDNPAMHQRLLVRFLNNAQTQVTDITTSAAANDTGTLTGVAHTLKSAARSVGALRLGERCQNLETAGRTGHTQAYRALAEGLEDEFAATQLEINGHLGL